MPDHEHEPMSSSEITEILAELERSVRISRLCAHLPASAMGLLHRNGEFRRNPITGELQPVYVATELGERMGPILPGNDTEH